MTKLEIKDLPKPPRVDLKIKEYNSSFESKLDATQKEWYYWTNYSRSNPRRFWDSVIFPILKVFPAFRNNYTASLKEDLYNTTALPLVKYNQNLTQVANLLAVELFNAKSGPSHNSPSGSSFESRMKSINIKKCAGENISFGPPNPLLMLVLLYIDEGVGGLGHRKALLNSSFVEMGIGVSRYPENKVMIVQDFSCEQD